MRPHGLSCRLGRKPCVTCASRPFRCLFHGAGSRSRHLLQSAWTYINSVDMCGSSYGSPALTFSSTLAFQQYGTVLGLEITSENAQTNSIDVKKYEAIYGIAGIHGNYPTPPGVRSSMVLGSPAVSYGTKAWAGLRA